MLAQFWYSFFRLCFDASTRMLIELQYYVYGTLRVERSLALVRCACFSLLLQPFIEFWWITTLQLLNHISGCDTSFHTRWFIRWHWITYHSWLSSQITTTAICHIFLPRIAYRNNAVCVHKLHLPWVDVMWAANGLAFVACVFRDQFWSVMNFCVRWFEQCRLI